MTERRIAVLTGGRAEYGLLRPVVRELLTRPGIDAGLIVTGAHLAHEFGHTVREIENDGLPIQARVESLLAGDTPAAVCRSMALGCIGVADVLERQRPDLLLLLGDRYEVLAAAQAAMVCRVPIAHVHGGEATEGLMDEAIRHAVTKMAHLHFAATEVYRQRIIRMGEPPERVFTVGAPGLDNLAGVETPGRAGLERDLGLPLRAPLLLVTYHPVTLAERSPAECAGELMRALDAIADATVVLTYPNTDTRGREIIDVLQAFVDACPERRRLVRNLGLERYLGTMRIADAVVGNSSSGLIEAPSCGVPTVNIGPRQKGRVRAASTIDCEEDCDAIVDAIHRSQSTEFRALCASVRNPYGDGHASARIADVIAGYPLDDLLIKSFFEVASTA